MSGPATVRRGSTSRRGRGPTRRRGVQRPVIRTPQRVRQALVRIPITAEQMRGAGNVDDKAVGWVGGCYGRVAQRPQGEPLQRRGIRLRVGVGH